MNSFWIIYLAFTKIDIAYSFSDFQDFYENSIIPKPCAHWRWDDKNAVEKILDSCPKTPYGDRIVDYSATIWILKRICEVLENDRNSAIQRSGLG